MFCLVKLDLPESARSGAEAVRDIRFLLGVGVLDLDGPGELLSAAHWCVRLVMISNYLDELLVSGVCDRLEVGRPFMRSIIFILPFFGLLL